MLVLPKMYISIGQTNLQFVTTAWMDAGQRVKVDIMGQDQLSS